MFKQRMRKKTLKHLPLWFVFTFLAVFLVACGSNGGPGSSPPSATPAPFKVTSVDLAVNPTSIAGRSCGSSASFTYTATFHIPAGTAGGTIQFMYTVNNGRSSSNASVIVAPGETTKTYTFTSSGMLSPDHTYPGIAQVIVNSPNVVNSPQVKPSGTCVSPTAFKVTSIDLSVNPSSIAGLACNSSVTLNYTATFHVAANSPGGTIQFVYTTNNGRSSTNGSVNVGAGATTATYTFTNPGTLLPDHTFPGIAEVRSTSPNAVNSPQVKPAGACTEASAFKVTSIDMTVSPKSLTGLSCGTSLTVTYTATFHIAPNSSGGTIQFLYTWNNGRATPGASITVGPGKTIATYSFNWAGQLSADHVLPGFGGVMTTSPNAISSPLVKPDGLCA